MQDHEGANNLGDLQLDDEPREEPRSSKSSPFGLLGLILLVLILAGAGSAYYFTQNKEPAVIVAAAPAPISTPEPSPLPSLAPTPLADTEETLEITPEPLPELNRSDEYLSHTLIGENNLASLAELMTPEEIIRKFVRAVYNISKGNVVNQYRPVLGPDSEFKAQAIGRMVEIPNPKDPQANIKTAVFKNPPKNQARYNRHIELLSELDTDAINAVYQRFYPLLQQAYQELGEGPEQFHTVMLAAIDILLATPQLEGEPELVLVSVQYQFLQPELEALPNSQKMMLRLGQSNIEKMRIILNTLRAKLASASI